MRARIVDQEAERCGLTEFEGTSLQSTLRRGWYWGGQAFRERVEKLIPKMKNRNYRSSAQGRDAGLRDARAILAEAQEHFGLGNGELRNLPRNDPRRAAVGWAIHRRCCVPLSWVADQLNLKSAANASQQIRRFEQRAARGPSKEIREWKKRMLKNADRPLKL